MRKVHALWHYLTILVTLYRKRSSDWYKFIEIPLTQHLPLLHANFFQDFASCFLLDEINSFEVSDRAVCVVFCRLFPVFFFSLCRILRFTNWLNSKYCTHGFSAWGHRFATRCRQSFLSLFYLCCFYTITFYMATTGAQLKWEVAGNVVTDTESEDGGKYIGNALSAPATLGAPARQQGFHFARSAPSRHPRDLLSRPMRI